MSYSEPAQRVIEDLRKQIYGLHQQIYELETELADSKKVTLNAHTLTLKFHRFLSEMEWRAVIDAARLVPHVVELEANAVQDLRHGG